MSPGDQYLERATVKAHEIDRRQIMSRRVYALTVPAAAIVAVAIAGCGGSGTEASSHTATAAAAMTSGGKGEVVKLSADPGGQLRFNMPTLTVAKPGTVTIHMINPSAAGMDHGIAIEGNGVDRDGPIVAPGKTSTVTVALKKGTYTYYCPVPGHKQAGMQGTLTVR
jgi:uncharacterized cupredoxin-like copper-binding protein